MALHHSMDKLQVSIILIFTCLALYLSSQIQSSAIFEDTLISSFVLLLSIGLAIRVASNLPATSNKATPSKPHDNSGLPIHRAVGGKSASAGRLDTLRKLRLIQVHPADETKLFAFTTLIFIRIECARIVLGSIACTTSSYAPLLPAIVAFATLLFPSKQLTNLKREKHDLPQPLDRPRNWLTKAQLLPLSAFCIAALFVLRSFASSPTTYICATSSPLIWVIPLMQHIGTALDAALLFCLVRILQDTPDVRSPVQQTTVLQLVGSAFTLSAIWLLFIHSLYYLIMHPFVPRIPVLSHAYFWSLMRMTAIVSAFSVATMLAVLYLDVVFTTFIIAVLIASGTAITQAGRTASALPHHTGVAAVLIMYSLFTVPLRAKLQTLHTQTNRTKSRSGVQLVYLTICTAVCIYLFSRRSVFSAINEHPIDVLLRDAHDQHQALVAGAKQSRNLDELIDNYSARYGRLPPPHFDKWYQYATSRNSTFIDDFDSIHQDLLPFYGLQPALIRNRTFELIANPWNGINAISIRDGRAYLGPRVGVMEQANMDTLRAMIDKFAKHLPDMDMAFNLYNEPRVAVPFERKRYLEEMAHLHEIVHVSQKQFQPGRSLHWPRLPDEGEDNSVMREVAYHAVWEQFAIAGCSPSSPARTQHLWDQRSACFACSVPHSPYGIVANWSLAADVCHQPDLAGLHGLFMAHDAYKGTSKLYPVFSTAKVAGFNDILYPNVLSYVESARPLPKGTSDTSWDNKTSDLFWRGSTTEGVSYEDRRWQGMLRQRFVHLTNNIKNTSPQAAILLPSSTSDGNPVHKMHMVKAKDIQQLLHTNVQITPDIIRCRGSDCDLQRWEFAPSTVTHDLTSHFQHKYLLDLDGQGWSSRFLPFLRSDSLPFKAGIFREWWHGRVTPWLHFVPLDIRGHGLWNTLAYFAGLDGSIGGQTVRVPARDEQAHSIAQAGRQWAEQTLRQEDMEIYMFRLLLEWGRMTDDWRDEIGFSGNRDITP